MPLFLLLLIIVVAVFAVRRRKRKKQHALILANPSQTTGRITGHRRADKYGGMWIKYEFTANGAPYWSEKKLYGTRSFNYLKDFTFTVIYCTTDPLMNRLLVNEEDFKMFHLQQPEQLKMLNKKVWS
jgi:hypothetical protein